MPWMKWDPKWRACIKRHVGHAWLYMSASDCWLPIGGLPFAKAAATYLASTEPALPAATHNSRTYFLACWSATQKGWLVTYNPPYPLQSMSYSATLPAHRHASLFAPETYITCCRSCYSFRRPITSATQTGQTLPQMPVSQRGVMPQRCYIIEVQLPQAWPITS